MSFLNAGDRDAATNEVLPDACAGFDCGEHGQCSAMNLTPTCVCDQGFVAVGNIDANGARSMLCVEPVDSVPAAFYDKRLPVLPADLPGGREVVVADVLPPLPSPDVAAPPSAGFPMPRGNGVDAETAASAGGGGCSMTHRGSPTGWLVALLLGLGERSRRRARARG